MSKPLGLERRSGYWDRHKKKWISFEDPHEPISSGVFKPPDDGRRVQCPVCGEMVNYARRHLHPCHYDYMKRVWAEAAEFEMGMVVSLQGGRRSWDQYGT